MPSRNFCDLCDQNIPTESRYFLIDIHATNVNESNSYYGRQEHLFIANRDVTLPYNKNMVCEACVKAIIAAALQVSVKRD